MRNIRDQAVDRLNRLTTPSLKAPRTLDANALSRGLVFMSVEFDPIKGTFEASVFLPSLKALCALGNLLKGSFDVCGVSSSFKRVNVSKSFVVGNTALCGTVDLSILTATIAFRGLSKNQFDAPKVLRARWDDFGYFLVDKG